MAYTRIDHETKQRILDAVDIVDVVSDFVTLKRRGANYIGLCPFHNERTPSFSVSKARGICKCFSCGKGGSAVNFLMELENMNYGEALRWLAHKYGIEIQERELTDEEREQDAERESMLAINDFAMKYFEKTMAETEGGRDIGAAYFRERGINEKSIEKFHLGYSLERGNGLIDAAKKQGFNEAFLEKTGLAARGDHGLYERFRGRVIYPVFTLSGRVVAFGGRTLRTDKTVAKYVNSPESVIYSKSRELYGMYQARRAIARLDKCILVEGYMDVISMHQNGVENVVASSGTSLTEQQIILIRRFTKNVTVIYDSDAAGIKASLRGIDMFLAQGMNVKVLLLPDGDDPDSFAQSHSASEVENYISENETDFIRFKSTVLLRETDNDPIKRASAIGSILQSVAVIPDQLVRQVYIDECSRTFGMDDKMLSAQIAKYIALNAEKNYKDIQRRDAAETIGGVDSAVADTLVKAAIPAGDRQAVVDESDSEEKLRREAYAYLAPFERELLRYAVRYAPMCVYYDQDENGNPQAVNAVDFISGHLEIENLKFVVPAHQRLFEHIIRRMSESWPADVTANEDAINKDMSKARAEGLESIRQNGRNLEEMERLEMQLGQRLEAEADARRLEFYRTYMAKAMCWDDDDEVRKLANELCSDRYELSKVHTKYAKVETEVDRLFELVPRAVFELKDAVLNIRIADLRRRIKNFTIEAKNGTLSLSKSEVDSRLNEMMRQMVELNRVRGVFAHQLGERIVAPTRLDRKK